MTSTAVTPFALFSSTIPAATTAAASAPFAATASPFFVTPSRRRPSVTMIIVTVATFATPSVIVSIILVFVVSSRIFIVVHSVIPTAVVVIAVTATGRIRIVPMRRFRDALVIAMSLLLRRGRGRKVGFPQLQCFGRYPQVIQRSLSTGWSFSAGRTVVPTELLMATVSNRPPTSAARFQSLVCDCFRHRNKPKAT